MESFVLRQTEESIGEWPFFRIRVGREFFSLSFDTGSDATWLYSDRVPEFIRGPRKSYTPNPASPCCDQNFSVVYGDGVTIFIDRAHLDVLGFGPTTTQSGHIIFCAGSVADVCGIAKSYNMEGILGLQPGSIGNTILPSFWQTLAPSLPEPCFTASFQFNGESRLTFGKMLTGRGEAHFWDGDVREQWRLPITSFKCGGKEPGEPSAKFDALVDTGCSSLRLPPDIVDSYYSLIPEHSTMNGLFGAPADLVLPDLYLYVGAEKYEVKIPGTFLRPQGVNQNGAYTMVTLEACTPPHGPILGQPFLFATHVILEVLILRQSASCGGMPNFVITAVATSPLKSCDMFRAFDTCQIISGKLAINTVKIPFAIWY